MEAAGIDDLEWKVIRNWKLIEKICGGDDFVAFIVVN